MGSIEGLWALLTAQYDNPDVMLAGGVVVLESGHVLGGDSMMAYVGTYTIERDNLTASVHSWTFNAAFVEHENVFGVKGGQRNDVGVEGVRVSDDRVEGWIFLKSQPDFRLRAVMEKIAAVPG